MTMAFLLLMAMEVDMSLAVVMMMAVHMPPFSIESSGQRPTENDQEQGNP